MGGGGDDDDDAWEKQAKGQRSCDAVMVAAMYHHDFRDAIHALRAARATKKTTVA